MARLRDSATLRALRHRNFQLFFAGQLISLVGTWMQNVAQSWLVYRLTGSSALLGLVSFVGQIPVLLLSPVGGYAADRWNRRTVVILTQSISMVLALALAGLTLTNTIQIREVFVLAALLGVVNSFDIPARQSFLVEMVGKEDMINAIALNSSMFNGARIAGPAIAGILVAQIGEGWCFFANGISYIAVIGGLLAMRMGPFQPAPRSLSAFHTIREGFRYVARTGPVLALLSIVGVLSFAGLPYLVLMPIYADSIFHEGPAGLGILMGVAGLGALIGALLLASRTVLTGLTRWVALAMVIFGITLGAFAYSRSLWFSCAMLLLMGFTGMIQMGAANTLIQSMVPDYLRGRVMSVYSMMYMGVGPFGAMFAGFAADDFGAPATLAVGAGTCLIAAAIYVWRLPGIRAGARELLRAESART
ncbi:MAG TPA: MFS transporter [Bryobacteraceae bacterium]|jgi:MFS family permease|nr:MFS transporter [Bryobacteraceae bacterium]